MSITQFEHRPSFASATNETALGRIRDVIAGGGSSNMRNLGVPRPLVIKSAQGCQITDVEGRELIDLNMGYGPHIFGYGDQDVLSRIAAQMKTAHMTGLPSNLDAYAAELIKSLVPSMEQVRFANSGTEAIASALRLARSNTRRNVVVTFEGHYHGWSETILRKLGPDLGPLDVKPGAAGMVPGALQYTRQVRWNDVEALKSLFETEGHEIAAVILEPVLANDGVAAPANGFLDSVRALTTQYGALLIFDEVITGFRVSSGGGQALYKVIPDLTVISKTLGGGFPVAAFGGSKDVMAPLARNEALHAGVYAGNHLAMIAVTASLEKIIERPATYQYLEEIGTFVEQRLRQGIARCSAEVLIERVGSIIGFSLVEEPLVHNKSNARIRPKFAFDANRRLQMRCQERGVYFHPNPREPWFLSTAHDRPILTEAIDVILETLEEEFPRNGGEGV